MILFNSCAGNKDRIFIPANEYKNENDNKLNTNGIIDTQAGNRIENIPDWLFIFLEGGINKAEAINSYRGRYLFIAKNEGSNFNALNKWAENYTIQNNFPMIAASRIERRLISAATLYPDDEYGGFFEIVVKKAFNAEYEGAVIEDSFWIKMIENETENDNAQSGEKYIFYILTSIEKIQMQEIIRKITAEAIDGINPSQKQSAAVKNIQQNFFEEF
ncbi:MAG: hypothetical protein LBB81_02675 [Treponema sp.]|nr:hypothetical protein [Treponema sp.]